MNSVDIVEADLSREEHKHAVLELIDAYSMDPMGNNEPLSNEARRNLIPGLVKHPTTIIFLAFNANKAVGVAVCFLGFSTFAARSLINVHDLAVLPAHRAQGIGKRLLKAIEQKARKMECCKLTLEVQENNHPAMRLYKMMGFSQVTYNADTGGALFFSKQL